MESVKLPGPIHKDPAARILIASARMEETTLVTRDEKILDYAFQRHLNCLQG